MNLVKGVNHVLFFAYTRTCIQKKAISGSHHSQGSQSTYLVMISESQLVAIHMMAAGGLTPQRIADVLDVSVEMVEAALKRRNDHGQDGSDK